MDAKLKQWMGCTRLTYNNALAHIKDGKFHKKTMFWLRNRFVNECNVNPAQKFLIDTPKHVREGACQDLAAAYKSNFQRMKTKPGHKFDMHFRRKKDVQSMAIPKASMRIVGSGIVIYPKMLSKDPIKTTSDKPLLAIKQDCRLSMDTLGRWILSIPTQVDTFTVADNQGERVCSIDPGIRTFATTWSPQGESYKIGHMDSSRMMRHLIQIDTLTSSISKASGKRKRRMQAALDKMRTRHANIMRDFHYQIANFLVKRYDTIVLPNFDSKSMASKLTRRLTTKTVRSMMGLGHGLFRQRLSDVAARRDTKVDMCTEEYTSKTCSRCGELHHTLGGAKKFTCKACGLQIDRDLQGAFNIYIKRLREFPGALPPATALER